MPMPQFHPNLAETGGKLLKNPLIFLDLALAMTGYAQMLQQQNALYAVVFSSACEAAYRFFIRAL
jgi:hypothetical protein